MLFASLLLGYNVANAQTVNYLLIHNSADTSFKTVDVYEMGTGIRIADDFNFRDANGLTAPAIITQIQVGIAPGNSTSSADVIFQKNLTLSSTARNIFVINGVGSTSDYASNPNGVSTALDIDNITNLPTAQVANQINAVFYNGVTDEDSLVFGTALRSYLPSNFNQYIVVNGQPPLRIFNGGNNSGIHFRDTSFTVGPNSPRYTADPGTGFQVTLNNYPFVAPSPAEYQSATNYPVFAFRKNPNGTNYIVNEQFNIDFSAIAGKNVVMLLSGFRNPSANRNGEAIQLLIIDETGNVTTANKIVKEATVQIIHASPDQDASDVDIFVNGTKQLTNIKPTNATTVTLPAFETVNIAIAEAGKTLADTVYSTDLFLSAQTRYVAVAHGLLNPSLFPTNPSGANLDFRVTAFTKSATAATAGTSDLTIFHAMPDVGSVGVGFGTLETDWDGNFPFSAAFTYGIRGNIALNGVSANTNIRLNLLDNSTNDRLLQFLGPIGNTLNTGSTLVLFGFLDQTLVNQGERALTAAVFTPDNQVSFLNQLSLDVNEINNVLAEGIRMYPNPSNNITNLSYNLVENANVSIRIIDQMGRVVSQNNLGNQPSGISNYTFDVSNFTPGIYSVEFRSGEFSSVQKLFVK
jgi:hypothetical protein